MGQMTCSNPSGAFQFICQDSQQITHKNTSQQKYTFQTANIELSTCDDGGIQTQVRVRSSDLAIKTLTEKYQQSIDNQLQKVCQSSSISKVRSLRRKRSAKFLMQFGTLKDLIESKAGKTSEVIEFSSDDESNCSSKSLERQNSQGSNQICQDLSVFIQKEHGHRHSFNKIEINIEDFIRVSEEPITQFYEFKEKIGEGSYGNVYRAICKVTQEERAIKVLKKKEMSKQSKKQFLAEMELLAKLDHPNIIKVYELYYYNTFYYVVTEYCQGGSILKLMSTKCKYSEKFVSEIMRQLLGALSYIHKNCIVHLDIKLENIVFLDEFKDESQKIYIKIIDFGCSKYFTPYKKMKSKITGTLTYIAPECLKGYYTEKCDIWSCGVLLYLLLTGVSPFKGQNSNQTRYNVEHRQLDFSQRHCAKLSAQSQNLIQQMLNRNASKRLSAKNCLQHRWFQKMKRSRSSSLINKEAISNLQKYYRGNNFVTIIETFISLRKINQQQRKILTDIFQELDLNHDGSIQVKELLVAYQQQCGFDNLEEISEVEHIINKVDINKSGSIDFNEFMVAMTDQKKIFERRNLEEAFDYFDEDKTGFIEKKELKKILKGCQRGELDYILQELDQDGDQKVSKQEFISYLIK